MGTLAFDRERVDSLRLALGAAVEELRAIRCSDADAAEVMRSLKGVGRTIEGEWLPRVHDILHSTAMTSCVRSAPGFSDMPQASRFAAMNRPGWEIANDPLAILGPPAPQNRTIETVLADIMSGDLQPMAAPIDAHGRAGANYTSLTFAPSTPPIELGEIDLTSNLARFVSFWSDGLDVGWDQTRKESVYRLDNVRVVKRAHPLTVVDRDDGPETMDDLTTVASVSGYMVVATESNMFEVSQEIGDGDPTAHHAYISQESSVSSGAFYPDTEPQFRPVRDDDPEENAGQWTFTTSSAPMMDDWATWRPM